MLNQQRVRIFHTEIITDTDTSIIGYRNVCNKSDKYTYVSSPPNQIKSNYGASTYPEQISNGQSSS